MNRNDYNSGTVRLNAIFVSIFQSVRIFRHYMPRSLLVLWVVEAIFLLATGYFGIQLRFINSVTPLELQGLSLCWRLLIYTTVVLGLLHATGLYHRGQSGEYREQVFRLAWTFALALPTFTILFYFIPEVFIGRGAFLIAFGLSFMSLLASRYYFLVLLGHRVLRKRVLVIGSGQVARRIQETVPSFGSQGLDIVGCVNLVAKKEMEDDDAVTLSDYPVVTLDQRGLAEYLDEQNIDEIVLAMDEAGSAVPMQAIMMCRLRGIQVTDVAQFFEQWLGKIELDSLRPEQVVHVDGWNKRWQRRIGKQSFDILVSLLILIACLPLMLITALCIFVESGGPIFYSQRRVGQNGEIFTVFKFRSMVQNAEKDGKPQWATKNDARVTRVGRFIRNTRIDELPQLLNVIKGDMSFVGPRPERPEFVDDLSKEIPHFVLRHQVKPGITGWAQICYPYGDSAEDAKQKLQFDLYYIKNYSLFLDITILFQTVQVVIWNQGAR